MLTDLSSHFTAGNTEAQAREETGVITALLLPEPGPGPTATVLPTFPEH